VNLVRGTGRSFVTWNAAALDTMVEAALLRLLAVEHFGRGRGDWVQGEAPPHWAGVVAAALAPLREALDAAWSARSQRPPADTAPDAGQGERRGGLGQARCASSRHPAHAVAALRPRRHVAGRARAPQHGLASSRSLARFGRRADAPEGPLPDRDAFERERVAA